MTQAIYRPLSDLTRVEREAHRLRQNAQEQRKREGKGKGWPEGIGPETRADVARRTVEK